MLLITKKARHAATFSHRRPTVALAASLLIRTRLQADKAARGLGSPPPIPGSVVTVELYMLHKFIASLSGGDFS
ncbi:hypothetical protein T440DRAFT_215636 [Plenodomus tracheiphilus IPT5]|uniref:Uncharacterized protein n=1 Tax=Plenodomus tracheiphilus IPT5 TaxID=1408161 RepID=A0A6A7AV95_9PLEO|nr:hypothetical protein T440DRAFT_215636 [Plenodomus tracheiphilus IPT5]